MGVAIEVFSLAHLNQVDPEGAAWIRESLAVANAILKDHGLAAFVEPEFIPNDVPPMRSMAVFLTAICIPSTSLTAVPVWD